MKVCFRCNSTTCRCPKRKRKSKAQYSDRAYRLLRAAYLAAHPYCADCRMVATEVHHTMRLSEHPETLLDTTTWQGLCKVCHAVRTAKGE